MPTKYLIYLTIFSAPLYLVKFSVFKINVNILDSLMILTILNFLFEKKRLPSLEKINLSSVFFSIILILIGLFVSSFINVNVHTLGIISSWFILPILFGIILFFETKNNVTKKSILATIYFSSGIVALLSLMYFFNNQGLTYDNRLKSFYLSPNYLAMYLSPGLIIAILQFNNLKIFSKKNRLSNIANHILLFVLTTSIFIVLFLTKSQGAWIAIVSSLFCVFIIKTHFFKILFFTKNTISKISKIFLFSFLFFSVLFFYHKNYSFQIPLSTYTTHSSLNSRLIIWQSAIKILKKNWLWGIGVGNFQKKYLEYQKYFPPYQEWAVPQPHNLYLAFWLQLGLIGFLGFAILIFYSFKKLLFNIRDSSGFQQRKIAITLLSLLFLFLIHGFVDTPVWKNDLSLIFWIIIFLIY